MKNAIVFLNAMLLTICSIAQTTETVKVTGGNDIAPAISPFGIYRLPAFVNGTIHFKDGKLGKEKLNYNILNGQVMYINANGDTMAIANADDIQRADLNGINFIYTKKSWLENVADAGVASLLLKRTVNIRFEKTGAFGIADASHDIVSYNSYISEQASYKIVVAEDASVTRLTSYFLLTKEGDLLPASKKSFLNYFSKNKKDINEYLDNHKVDFTNTQDLIKLLSYSISGKPQP